MKKIKKLLTIGLAVLLMFYMNISFVGCSKQGPIPNGKYIEQPTSGLLWLFTYSENSNFDFYIEIKGDTAIWVTSGLDSYRAKIVEKDGEIYFEGYKWKELFYSGERGSNDVYQVEYNENEKFITLYLVVIPVENRQ